MTLILIFAIVITLAILMIYRLDEYEHENLAILASLAIIFGTIALIVSIICYLPSQKDSEIDFNKALSAKETIESAMKSTQPLDRINLSESIIKFNDKVISNQANSKRFIIKDYYSKNANWNSIKLIEWSK